MDRLTERFEHFEQALATLEEALNLFATTQDDAYYQVLRDSVIKRFEYSIDTFWKFIKEYIEIKHGLISPATPKGVTRIALDAAIISLQEYNFFIDMIDSRNLTSHTYNKVLAQEISEKIPAYYTTMKTIFDRLDL